MTDCESLGVGLTWVGPGHGIVGTWDGPDRRLRYSESNQAGWWYLRLVDFRLRLVVAYYLVGSVTWLLPCCFSSNRSTQHTTHTHPSWVAPLRSNPRRSNRHAIWFHRQRDGIWLTAAGCPAGLTTVCLVLSVSGL